MTQLPSSVLPYSRQSDPVCRDRSYWWRWVAAGVAPLAVVHAVDAVQLGAGIEIPGDISADFDQVADFIGWGTGPPAIADLNVAVTGNEWIERAAIEEAQLGIVLAVSERQGICRVIAARYLYQQLTGNDADFFAVRQLVAHSKIDISDAVALGTNSCFIIFQPFIGN